MAAGVYFVDDRDPHRITFFPEGSTTTVETAANTTAPIFDSNSCYSNLMIHSVPKEAPVVHHKNGDLFYLYRPPARKQPVRCRTNHRRVIRQPCWRAGRWKSLT